MSPSVRKLVHAIRVSLHSMPYPSNSTNHMKRPIADPITILISRYLLQWTYLSPSLLPTICNRMFNAYASNDSVVQTYVQILLYS